MAVTSTTLGAAVALNDLSINVASATGFGAGNLIKIDDEIMVQTGAAVGTIIPVRRGVEGTKVAAHVTAAFVRTGLPFTSTTGASDFGNPSIASDPVALFPPQRPRRILSYTAAGPITLPTPGEDMLAILNGTTILAMTLANPAGLNDGDKLTVGGNGKAAHTVTYSTGLGNVGATADVVTFKADQSQAVEFIAIGGFWANTSLVAGAATVAGAGLG